MTFNPNSKNQKLPLVTNESKGLLESLQKKYLTFIKIYDNMVDFEKKLTSFTRKEYNLMRDDIHYKIQQLPKLLHEILLIIKNIESNDNQDSRTVDQIKIINNKLNPKQSEIQILIKKIIEKEEIVAKKLSVINPDDIEKASKNFTTESSCDSNNTIIENTDDRRSSIDYKMSNIIVRDVMDQDDYLKNRCKELEEMKKVASQIKSISQNMKQEIIVQGENLNQIDGNVDEVKKNVINADIEIVQAKKNSTSDTKRFCMLTGIIVFILVSLFLIMFFYVFK